MMSVTDSTRSKSLGAEVPAPPRGHIRKLSLDVINRIAAGEVVQRPSAALKELLENGIDAGCRTLHISCADGGLGALQVRDDGCGIAPEDFPLLCERYATSKLQHFQDLAHIGTFGFRGEALASLSYVGRVEITSRQRGGAPIPEPNSAHAMGWKAFFSDGALLSQPPMEPCAANLGTTIRVEHLFAANPARRAALKPTEEWSRVLDVTTRYALAFPRIGFSCWKEGGSAVGASLVSTASSKSGVSFPKDSTTLQNIRLAYGHTVASHLRLLYFLPQEAVERAIKANAARETATATTLTKKKSAARRTPSSPYVEEDGPCDPVRVKQEEDSSLETTQGWMDRMRPYLYESGRLGARAGAAQRLGERLPVEVQEALLQAFQLASETIRATGLSSMEESSSTKKEEDVEVDPKASAAAPLPEQCCTFAGYTSDITLPNRQADQASSTSRGTSSSYLSLFINNRLVEHAGIRRLIEATYAPLFSTFAPSTTQKPFTVLFLSVPGHRIDTNVHPTKKEVSLLDEETILFQLGKILRETVVRSAEQQQMDLMKLGKAMTKAPTPGHHRRDSVNAMLMLQSSVVDSPNSATSPSGSRQLSGGALNPSTLVRTDAQRGALDLFFKSTGPSQRATTQLTTFSSSQEEHGEPDHPSTANVIQLEEEEDVSSNEKSRKRSRSIAEEDPQDTSADRETRSDVVTEGVALPTIATPSSAPITSLPTTRGLDREEESGSRMQRVAEAVPGSSSSSTSLEACHGLSLRAVAPPHSREDEEELEDDVVADFRRFQASQRQTTTTPSTNGPEGGSTTLPCDASGEALPHCNGDPAAPSDAGTELTLADSPWRDSTTTPSTPSAPPMKLEYKEVHLMRQPDVSPSSSSSPSAPEKFAGNHPSPPLLSRSLSSVLAIVKHLDGLSSPSALQFQTQMVWVGMVNPTAFLVQSDVHLLLLDARYLVKEFVFQSLFRRWMALGCGRAAQYALFQPSRLSSTGEAVERKNLDSPQQQRRSTAPPPGGSTPAASWQVLLPPPSLRLAPPSPSSNKGNARGGEVLSAPVPSSSAPSVERMLDLALGCHLGALCHEPFLSDALMLLLVYYDPSLLPPLSPGTTPHASLGSDAAQHQRRASMRDDASEVAGGGVGRASRETMLQSRVARLSMRERQRVVRRAAPQAMRLLFETATPRRGSDGGPPPCDDANDETRPSETTGPDRKGHSSGDSQRVASEGIPTPKPQTQRYVRRLQRRLTRLRGLLAEYFGVRLSDDGQELLELPQDVGVGGRSSTNTGQGDNATNTEDEASAVVQRFVCFWPPQVELAPLLLLRIADCVPYSTSFPTSTTSPQTDAEEAATSSTTPRRSSSSPSLLRLSDGGCDAVLEDEKEGCAAEVRCLTAIARHIAETLYGNYPSTAMGGDGHLRNTLTSLLTSSTHPAAASPFPTEKNRPSWKADSEISPERKSHGHLASSVDSNPTHEECPPEHAQVMHLEALQWGLFPCLKQQKLFRLPSACLVNGSIQHVVSVESLYKVFERC